MSKQIVSICAVVMFVVGGAYASPLSVRIDDHDFTFDMPYWEDENWGAAYDYHGADPDELYVDSRHGPAMNHYVGTYSYMGKLPTVATAAQGNPYGDPPVPSPFPYPVANDDGSGFIFGGDLELSMTFSHNDGPYVDANTGDVFDISLVGSEGYLMVTGRILDPVSFKLLYPDTGVDTVLFVIDFTSVSLLARVNEDRIFLVEGKGDLKTLLGHDVPADPRLPDTGVTFFKFFAENPQSPIFTDALYQPTDDVEALFVGHLAGEVAVPEPGTLALLTLGGVAIVSSRKRRRSA